MSQIDSAYLVKIDLSYVDIIFEWANDEETRKNSFNSEKIEYESHVAWMKRKLADSNCLFYVMKHGDSNVGQLRIDVEGNKGIISYSISKDFRGMGYGKVILSLAEEQTDIKVNELVGTVKYSNVASQKCFEKLGYKKLELDDYVEYHKLIGDGR